MGYRTTIDLSRFNAVCKELSKGSGTPLWPVILSEVGHILGRCVQLTTEDKFDKIKTSVEFKNRTLRFGTSEPPVLYFTKDKKNEVGGVGWFWDPPGPGNEGKAMGARGLVAGGTFHPMTEFWRYGDPRFGKYEVLKQELMDKQIDVKAVLGRAGQSWVQIGNSLGIELSPPPPAYVRNAPPFKGTAHVNGRSIKTETTNGLELRLINSAPVLLGTIDGNRILQVAVNGRIKVFSVRFRKGVFENYAERARLYPGVFVR
jgi:hypothetical protein